MSKILIVTALHRELPDRYENPFFNHNILFTGVGKINATYELTKVLSKDRFDLVINYGTAASKVYQGLVD